jgi:mannose/fructose/N-acetylgalactosamine-specific phosphotransferase system component IIC
MNSLGMQVVHISNHITTIKYKKIKMINLIHIISILNYVFTIVFYATRWTKQDVICICFEEFLNQLNSLYIWICLYL